MNNVTNITELAEFFSDTSAPSKPVRVQALPMLRSGETYEQMLARRAATAERIEAKNKLRGIM